MKPRLKGRVEVDLDGHVWLEFRCLETGYAG